MIAAESSEDGERTLIDQRSNVNIFQFFGEYDVDFRQSGTILKYID